MQKVLILIFLSILPMLGFAENRCGVIAKIEKSPNNHPIVHFVDGTSVKIFDNWTQVSLATTAFSTKAKFCVDKAGVISIEH